MSPKYENDPLRQPVYPFTAIVGQTELKHALLLVAIDPLIGGVLALGDRGTGKSTAVRALARLLPTIRTVADCPFHCDPDDATHFCSLCRERTMPPDVQHVSVPVVDLPLGASEDRITGGLDIEAALTRGKKQFEPGLLGRANRGFLYIDEVNLLEDHLVDLLLDVAASGVNVVEREGISMEHPARFVMIGSGNPEEGDLRPQLLDRFGLYVPVRTVTDIRSRVEIVRRRDEFERDPHGFAAKFARREADMQAQITAARVRLASIDVPDELLEYVAHLSVELGLDGHRGELVLVRAARSMAALAGKDAADIADAVTLAPLALGHRVRRDPLDDLDAGDRVREVARRLAPREAAVGARDPRSR